jgi:hypothetical protein
MTSPTLIRLSLTKPVSSCPTRTATVTDHVAAAKADYEGGDYSPEADAAVRAYERNRAELARQGTFSFAPVSNGSVSNETPLLLEGGRQGAYGTGLVCLARGVT